MIGRDSASLFNEYQDICQKAADFNNAAAVLSWDQEVYMPRKGFAFRGRQLGTLASHAHELLTSEKFGAVLNELAGRGDLSEDEQANVLLSLEDYNKQRKLTREFVEQLTKQTSDSYAAWIHAREMNDFSLYASELERMVALKRQQADMYGYEHHPYDALLDEYEKGANVKLLDGIFQKVKTRLPAILEKISKAEQVDSSVFEGDFAREKQFAFSLEVLKAMGYDLDAGRQDYSEHPFSISFSPSDVRVTTRVSEKNLSSLLWSSIHEGGHALYEQGLQENYYGLPLGAAVSLSIHESQSRLWENCVGRSKAFWGCFYPVLQQYFPDELKGFSAEQFYKASNKVQPSLIRTESDELTYHFHVMVRYEIEKALLARDIQSKDLPSIWNSEYHNYLGISPTDDRTGVLQDVHWSHGSFGYFPTYSLGSFYAAQFFAQAESEIAGLTDQVSKGSLANLLNWLRHKIHIHGRKYSSEDLCKKVTGKGLDVDVFLEYAERKYSGIYNIDSIDHVP